MAKEQTTPEEKLLRLIEAPKILRSRLFGRKKPAKRTAGQLFWQKLKLKKDIFSPAFLSQSLVVLAVGLSLGLFWQIIASRRDLARENWQGAVAKNKNLESKAEALGPLSGYLEEFSRTNMFSASSEAPSEAQDTKPKEDIAARLKNLKLVGIIWSNNPQAMIENTAENKTLLLNTGDQMDNIKIKKIYEDRVILELANQEWELR